MDIAIAIAIIGGIAAVLSPVITLLLKKYLDNKNLGYEKVDRKIRDVIYGKWKGNFEQTIEGISRSYKLEMELKVTSSGAITGKAKYPFKSDIHEVMISGGFYSQRFLKMNYENFDKSILQFGAFVLKLSDSAKTIEGCFIGYGHISGIIMGGKAILNKV